MCQAFSLYHILKRMHYKIRLFHSFYNFFTFWGPSDFLYELGELTWRRRAPSAYSASCTGLILLLLLLFFDKIEVYTSNLPCFIFYVIPHITSALCKLTGSCNILGGTGFSIQIKRDPICLIELQLFLQRLEGCLFLFGS